MDRLLKKKAALTLSQTTELSLCTEINRRKGADIAGDLVGAEAEEEQKTSVTLKAARVLRLLWA